MGQSDPFPALPYQAARSLLEGHFGVTKIRWNEPFGPVIIFFPPVSGLKRSSSYSWQQAKYLALHPQAAYQVRLGQYPKDWPS